MSQRNFRELLEGKWKEGKFLCVGLDSDLDKIPEIVRQGGPRETLVAFNRAIVDATHDLAGSYKSNSAFYEAHGDQGFAALRETISYIREVAPDVPVILDAKRGDIGNTNAGYIDAAFGYFGADAITVHPYMGRESLQPFLDRADKGIIVLCRTSNPGAGEFQDLKVDGTELYKIVAQHVVKEWNTNGNCCVMVGATYPEELAQVRSIIGDMPILIAGIGAQNGDLEKTIKNGLDSRKKGLILSASRSVIFTSSGADYAAAARTAAEKLDSEIRKAL